MAQRGRVGALVGAFTMLLSADLAGAACTESSEARVVSKSIRQAMRCDYKTLRSGPDPGCTVDAPPACAGSLVTDANNLAYGLGALAEVDASALSDQLKCQKRIGKARRALRRHQAALSCAEKPRRRPRRRRSSSSTSSPTTAP